MFGQAACGHNQQQKHKTDKHSVGMDVWMDAALHNFTQSGWDWPQPTPLVALHGSGRNMLVLASSPMWAFHQNSTPPLCSGKVLWQDKHLSMCFLFLWFSINVYCKWITDKTGFSCSSWGGGGAIPIMSTAPLNAFYGQLISSSSGFSQTEPLAIDPSCNLLGKLLL